MKSNPDKCHLLVSTNDNVKIRIGNFQIENTEREKLLGIQFDNKLSFDYHFSEICKKASRKLYALGRVTPYINFYILHSIYIFQLAIQLLPTYMDVS